MKPTRLLSALAVAALLIAACVKPQTEIAVESVSVTPTSMELTVGDTHSITATVSPSDATNKAISWKSSDSGIASVADGKVTAVAPGNATITVTTTDGGKTATCAVKVNAKPVPVSSVSLSEKELKLVVGDKATLTATVLPEDATDKSYTWSSSDDKIATVKDGEVEAIAPGKATITVTTTNGGKTATCEVTVEAPVVNVSSVSVSPEAVELVEGSKATLTATVLPEDATDKTVSWSTSDSKIATVKDGQLEAIAPGTATITVTTTDGGKTASCKVTVKAKTIAVTGVKISKSELELKVGEEASLTATVEPETASNKNVVWSADPESVVKVSKDGKVTAVAEGTGTVTATTEDGGFKASCKVTVTTPYVAVTGIKVDPEKIEIMEEAKIDLSAEVIPSTATDTKVKFVIADESIISATSTEGNSVKLLGVKAGDTKITVKAADGISKDVPVTVIPKPVIPPAVTLTVDLGLPSGIIWATANVGGTYPWDIGDYFAWGEISPKSTYTWDNYKWGSKSTSLTKYVMFMGDGTVDGRQRLLEEDDAATANMGPEWRIPTADEANELIKYCTWEKTSMEGVQGYKLTGPNGNTMFLPLNGFKDTDVKYNDRPYIMTSDLFNVLTEGAESYFCTRLSFESSSEYPGTLRFHRPCGIGVRGILKSSVPKVEANQLFLSKSSIELEENHRWQLYAKIPTVGTNDISIKWSSSNTDVAIVGVGGLVTAKKSGSATITATTSNGKSATCAVTVKSKEILPEEITLSQTEIYMQPMKTAFVTVNVLPTEATNRTVTPSYSNEDLIVVENIDDKGVARIASFNAKGSCLLTFTTVNGLSASVKVVVGDPPAEPDEVDLGLPSGTVWAAWNVGASKPEEYGKYYAWGDTDDKTNFTRDTYYYYWEEKFQKYNTNDGKMRLNFVDDQAWWVYGGKWRTPTVAQWQELFDNCSVVSDTRFGMLGAKITGPNGNSIFLPFDGYIDGTASVEKNTSCYYWTSDRPTNEGAAYFSWITNDGTASISSCGKIYGLPVRAVKPGNKMPKVSNPSLGHEWVDLGLSALWATTNLGATQNYQIGNFYAWGETKPQGSGTYDWSSYKYCSGSMTSLTKYNTDSDYGNVDGLTKLVLTDDAARANWGGEWRMPTKNEMKELINNCNFTQTTLNGYDVVKITSKINGRSIYVRMAGYYWQNASYDTDCALFWTSETDVDGSYYGSVFYFSNGETTDWVAYKRRVGIPVRPVITAPEQALLKALSRRTSKSGRPGDAVSKASSAPSRAAAPDDNSNGR